jgi:hypothetical protein
VYWVGCVFLCIADLTFKYVKKELESWLDLFLFLFCWLNYTVEVV